jgi:hypothetical protein
MKIWTFGRSPQKWGQNAWKRIKKSTVPVVWATLESFSFSAIQITSCRDWWPWKKTCYITMTWRQGYNQWSGSTAVHPAPKYYECKNPMYQSFPFLGSRRHNLHWLFSKGSNYQRGVLRINYIVFITKFVLKILYKLLLEMIIMLLMYEKSYFNVIYIYI